MSKKELDQIVDEPIVDEVTYAPDEILAKIIKQDDGYHVVDLDGTVGPVCKLVDEGGKTIALTKNTANRWWANKAKADAAIDADGFFPLYYKASKKFGPAGSRATAMPNAKLISYLSEEEQEEYKAIIARAMAAKEADKKKPMTELEKAKAAAERAKAKYEQLLKDAEGGNI